MQKGTARPILRMARPHFLIPGVLLYILGAMLALVNGAPFDLGKFLLGYAIFFCADLSVSFSNEYFDRESDAMAERTPFSGGTGALVERPELSFLALFIAVTLLALSFIAAIAFTVWYSYSVWFLLYAIMGGLLGWFYTAPPLKLAYRGLGEASTAIGSGLVMPGMGYWVMSGGIDLWFLILSLPLICYGVYFILSVEMPDVEYDRVVGKVNLMVRRGIGAGGKAALLATAMASIMLFAIAYTGVLGQRVDFWVLALFSLLPLALAAFGLMRDLGDRKVVISQVRLNLTGMMVFLVFAMALVYSSITAP